MSSEDTHLTRKAFLKEGLQALKHFGRDVLANTLPDLSARESLIGREIACIELTECTAYKGSGCRVCFDVCPFPDIAITLTENLPQVLLEGCTGCNICVEQCPTPNAIALRHMSMPT